MNSSASTAWFSLAQLLPDQGPRLPGAHQLLPPTRPCPSYCLQGLAETLCGSPLYMAPEILHFHKSVRHVVLSCCCAAALHGPPCAPFMSMPATHRPAAVHGAGCYMQPPAHLQALTLNCETARACGRHAGMMPRLICGASALSSSSWCVHAPTRGGRACTAPRRGEGSKAHAAAALADAACKDLALCLPAGHPRGHGSDLA